MFIAPPAAGKGTQSRLVSEKYHIPHISMGDILRDLAKEDTELGHYIAEVLSTGGLVKDEITYQAIEQRLQKEDCKGGYILDGFPRSLEQAYKYDEMLEENNQELGNVILLEAPKELTKKRILGHENCPKCGKIYNKLFDNMKSKVDGICDNCGSELVTRDDDNEESFEKRYQTYLAETAPIIEYYQNKGNLIKVDSSLDQDTVFKQIEKIITGATND